MIDYSEFQNKLFETSIEVGHIANYYGGVHISTIEGKYYWCVENYSDTLWEEIPKSLWDELLKFSESFSE